MGKHERQSIEEAEKIVVKILKKQNLNFSDKKNHWFAHAIAIAKRIVKDFPNIASASHLGNRYDNTGDILILSKGNEFFIETKMSDTKTGVGTKANISQDALTENHLFEGQPKSWSEFRQMKKHEKWVNDYLDQFAAYPNNILNITDSILMKEEKARYLRKLKKKGNQEAVNILNSIHERDKKEKIEYLTYLSSQKQNKEMVKRFLILIILGIHKKEELKKLIHKDNFFEEIKNLIVYYSNLDEGKILVRKENVGERIEKIVGRYSEYKVVFPEGLTHCKLVGMKGKTLESLLQIVFHWKNIAQGIKTPCLNIFDLTVNPR